MRSALVMVGEPVCDDYGGASPHEFLQSLLHETLAFGVESRGGLVRIRIAGSFEDGAGNADALALASRKTAAAVADHGVVVPRGCP